MTIVKHVLLLVTLAGGMSCNKQTSSDIVVKTGTIQQQGVTTYQYGTHLLIMDASNKLVLKSSAINLDEYIGARVKVTATNTHYRAEDGPELYNVTLVVRE